MDRFKEVIEILEDFKKGNMIIVTDNEDRENEGDLVMAGELITPDDITFMATKARGLICAPISLEYSKRLGLKRMSNQEDKQGTAFTVSCDVKEGTTTGISSSDRAKTIKALSNPESKKEDFHHPGHIFPLIAKKQGVLEREGHTEAAIDLCLLSGLKPCGVICEIINDDGTMARGNDLDEFELKYNLKRLTIKELKEYKRFLYEKKPILIPTKYGSFYLESLDNKKNESMPHLLIYQDKMENPLNLRIHSECLTGDLLGSKRCDCGDQLDLSLKYIGERGGAIIYLRQEGRGIGLINKLRAYNLQDKGLDTLDANLVLGFKEDEREYSMVSSLLKERGILEVNLLTNNPLKVTGLEDTGINVVSRIPIEGETCISNKRYLETKKDRMGHLLSNRG
ncbi:3,4-dihydroxy-2-butanone-4-phosphate synthase [Thiospirochaeta perfilievii]|uniref:GTP cyclohydrolase-2 n=1 Tax=Thiospirochaeta perfilievii TaxID=252967 RepID=A0A5C1Q904_9SPIO|nr:3,4-dihydroxy-2-butanone-4-phosphate synthase [Thiospirochaeta perfilievii]QEN04545.1 3,4-dihydroxy-2-butanone-4-phosphate synthase [Thiospirochaeta perfilievii]